MKILITGASGFFGKSLIRALEKSMKGFECYCLYKTNAHALSDERFKWFHCDLLNLDKTTQLLSEIKPTHLVHLAWHVPPQQFWTATENIDWLRASTHLFKEFCKNNGQVFIGAGTLAEYDWTSGVLDENETLLAPQTLYGQCKKSLHEILLNLRKIHSAQTKIIWLRIGHFFGLEEPKEKLIPKLINCIKNDLPINLASKDFKRPYAHIRYFGEITEKLLSLNEITDLTFNMSTDHSYSLKEIADFIKQTLNKQSDKIMYDAYPSMPLNVSVNTDCLRKLGLHIPDTFFNDLTKMIEKLK